MDRIKVLEVYQIKGNAQDRHYKIFESYDRVVEHFGKIDFNDYECIYKGVCKESSTLGDVYEMCNLYHPVGYTGHSLSVSDIVHMDGKYYYCDSIGWKELDIQND